MNDFENVNPNASDASENAEVSENSFNEQEAVRSSGEGETEILPSSAAEPTDTAAGGVLSAPQTESPIASPQAVEAPHEKDEQKSAEAVSDFRSGEVKTAYNPQSGTYSYSKPGEMPINGCAWDNTAPARKKKEKSSRGFKVFAASMLTVFTLSAVTIAAFMANDYMETRASRLNTDRTAVAGTVNMVPDAGSLATMLSTFKDSEEGLTKAQVAAKCGPSAVGIVVEVESASSYYGFFGNMYSGPQIATGVGSGFIYSDDGYIVTNHHVVEGARRITVYLSDKTQVEAELVGSDSLSDIAVIKIDPTGLDLVPMEIGNSAQLIVGDEVIAIGCPAGIEYMGTVTDGIISAINRDVELTEDGRSTKKTMTLLQTNATINKGNSGGPLINAKGQVIGINTLKLGSNYEGIGFSIPINGALPIIEQLIEYGEVKERSENDFVSSEGVIGISASAISASEAEYYDIPRGVLVLQIDKDSSAAKAGLRRGDIITAYNGTEVQTVEELNRLKSANKAGDLVTITVFRDSDDDDDDDDDDERTFDISFTLDRS